MMTSSTTRALTLVLACAALGACHDDSTLWIAMNGGETHIQLVEEEPDPF